MDVLIIIALIAAAVILFLVELFVIPGISLAGISALVCIIYANYYAFANLGTGAGFITLIISGIACIGSLVWFMRSKTLDKLALKKDITSKIDRSAAEKVKVGDTGITITRLAQIGNAEINGNIIEVKSMDGLLNEKTPIVVNRITDGIIFVEKLKSLYSLKIKHNYECRTYVSDYLLDSGRYYLPGSFLSLCTFFPMAISQSIRS